MKVIFYSKQCKFCLKLLTFLKQNNILNNYKLICVDNNDKIPKEITSVPTLVDSDLAQPLVGKNLFEYFNNKKFFDFPSNNLLNWENKVIPKPKVEEDKKALDELALQNNKERL